MKQLIYIFFSFFIFISCTKKQELNSITTLELKELLSKEKIVSALEQLNDSLIKDFGIRKPKNSE